MPRESAFKLTIRFLIPISIVFSIISVFNSLNNIDINLLIIGGERLEILALLSGLLICLIDSYFLVDDLFLINGPSINIKVGIGNAVIAALAIFFSYLINPDELKILVLIISSANFIVSLIILCLYGGEYRYLREKKKHIDKNNKETNM